MLLLTSDIMVREMNGFNNPDFRIMFDDIGIKMNIIRGVFDDADFSSSDKRSPI